MELYFADPAFFSIKGNRKYLETNFTTAGTGGLPIVPNEYFVDYQANRFSAAYYAPMLLNMLISIVFNGKQTIIANFSYFLTPRGVLKGSMLQFVAYVRLAIVVAPDFAGLYPTLERLSNFRVMQYSNGLRVIPL